MPTQLQEPSDVAFGDLKIWTLSGLILWGVVEFYRPWWISIILGLFLLRLWPIATALDRADRVRCTSPQVPPVPTH